MPETTSITLRAATGRSDFGFAEELRLNLMPESRRVVLDASRVRGSTGLFAARLQLALEVYRAAGQDLDYVPPTHPNTAAFLERLGVGQTLPIGAAGIPNHADPSIVLPLVRLTTAADLDVLMDGLFPTLVDHFDDVALVRDAVQMAISELCQNGVEHGTNPHGCVMAVTRTVEQAGHSRLALAVADLGVGIPNHLRRRRTDLVVDEHAIATAVQEGVTGTTREDRGHGFEWVFTEALASAATGALMAIRAGQGRFRREFAGGPPRDSGGPAAYLAGTAVAYELTSVLGQDAGSRGVRYLP